MYGKPRISNYRKEASSETHALRRRNGIFSRPSLVSSFHVTASSIVSALLPLFKVTRLIRVRKLIRRFSKSLALLPCVKLDTRRFEWILTVPTWWYANWLLGSCTSTDLNNSEMRTEPCPMPAFSTQHQLHGSSLMVTDKRLTSRKWEPLYDHQLITLWQNSTAYITDARRVLKHIS